MPVLDSPPQTVKLKRPSLSDPVPPLENGDCLSGEDFMRRYEAMPDVKAELVNGIVFMASPVRHTQHANPHHLLSTWLGVYRSRHPELEGGDNGTVLLGPKSKLQPDLYLLLPSDRGGIARIGPDGYVHGPPALVVEVAASTVSLDANQKAEAYHAAGVPEYLLWRVEEERIDWYERTGDRYFAMLPNDDGLIESKLFPGLILDPAALLRRDLARVLSTVVS